MAGAQDIPSTAEPGRTKRHLEERPLHAPSGESLVPESIPEQAAPAQAAQIKFILQKVIVEGASVYNASEFESLYKAQLGTEVALTFVYDIANQITARYRNEGYILSRAIVPVQHIKDGTITIQVVEGYISNVVFENMDDKIVGILKRYSNKIVAMRPLNSRELERYLLLMRDVSGVYVESLLRSGSVPGSAELLIAHSYDRFDASLTYDNYGTDFLGPLQGTARLQGNGLLSAGDQVALRYTGTDDMHPYTQQDMRTVDFRYRRLLGSEGMAVGISALQALSYPKDSLETLEVKTRSKNAAIGISYPFVRSRRMSLSGGAQFDYQNDQTQILGDVTADDRLRSLRLNATFDYTDSTGITQVFTGVSQGMKILNNSSANSPNISRTGGKPNYSKANIEIARLQHIYGPVNLYASVAGQYSPHRLLAAEEFGVGGSVYGRGYDPSEITGDRGVAGKLELQYNSETAPLVDGFQIYGFYDVGAVYQTENIDGGGVSLASAGVGIRVNVADWLTGMTEVAQPLTRPVSTQLPVDGRDSRVFFSLTARY